MGYGMTQGRLGRRTGCRVYPVKGYRATSCKINQRERVSQGSDGGLIRGIASTCNTVNCQMRTRHTLSLEHCMKMNEDTRSR